MSLNTIVENLITLRGDGGVAGQLQRPADASLVPLTDAINDVLTQRDAEIAELKRKLEEEVRAREDHQTTTALLRQTQQILRHRTEKLNVALKQAAASNEAKSSFLANVSHEFRTPMNGIIGMSELLLRSELSERQQSLARTIVESGRALVVIINDILDFSKIDAGKIELQPLDFDFRSCVNDVMALLSVQASSKGISLESHYSNDLSTYVVGDAGRIRQVLTNLIGNAVKFTDQGRVDVHIHLEAIGPELGIFFEVIDTGPGVPESAVQSIFEKFSQVDNTSTRMREGTGLGLAICKQLVETMKGEIGVESELHNGSRFYFRIRLPRSEAPKPLDISQFVMAGQRIHIITNGVNETDTLAERLSDQGVKATIGTVDESSSALTHADTVVVYCQEAQTDGAQAVEKLRKLQRGFDIPIVVAPAVGVIGDGAMLEESGIAGFMPLDTMICEQCEIIRRTLFAHKTGAKGLVSKHSIDRSSATEVEQPETLALSNASTSTQQAASKSSCHVLVVDDSLVNRTVAAEFLSEMGCRVSMAVNGREAVELVARESFDVVLMDCQMPEMDGLEAARVIRQSEAADARLPIVALTANAFDSDREKCLDAGMDEFIAKPLVPEELEKVITRFAPAQASAA
ncbi:MAG: response regulator [Hyphomicrobiaceae bacterium]